MTRGYHVVEEELRRAGELGLDLDGLSDLNLVSLYREELGGSRFKILGRCVRLRMLRLGLLDNSASGRNGKFYTVTEKCRMLLRRLEEDGKNE